MKSTGIIRRVDVLGRVVIPKELRKMLKINEGDPIEIYVERDEVILKKYYLERSDTNIASVFLRIYGILLYMQLRLSK